MANLSQRAAAYLSIRDTCVLDPDDVEGLAVNATQYYAGWASMASDDGEAPFEITGSTEVTTSEWSLIEPLFVLYVEKEQAVQMEATQVMGITQFGRTSSEISGEIQAYKERLPQLAFNSDIITI